MRLHKDDVRFIRTKLMPWVDLRELVIQWSASEKKWPDIWVEQGRVPVITVTREWARQGVHERRKRLVHEGLHLRGLKHGRIGGLEYSTKPSRDEYSVKIYQELVGMHFPGKERRRLVERTL